MCLRVVEKDIVRENAEAFSLPEMHAFLAVVAATGTKGMRKLVASFKYTTCRRATRAQRIEVHARLVERLLLGRGSLFALLQDEVAANGAKSREQRLVMEERAAQNVFGPEWCDIFIPAHLRQMARSLKYIKDEQGVDCSICLSKLTEKGNGARVKMSRLECGHKFCTSCLKKHYRSHGRTCPECRTPSVSRVTFFLPGMMQ